MALCAHNYGVQPGVRDHPLARARAAIRTVQKSNSHAIRLSAMRENVISEEAAMIFGDSSGVHRVESHSYCNSVPFGMALMRLSDQ